MKNSEYWKQRFIDLEKMTVSDTQEYFSTLEKEFKKAKARIEKDILAWYSKFAVNNNISLSEAKKLLNSKELEEFKWTLEDYIKFANENAINPKWVKQLKNASAKYHISRLESLEIQLKQEIEKLYNKYSNDTNSLMKDIYSEQYYRTAFEVQKGFEVGYGFEGFNAKELELVIKKPWTVDGLNFSTRIRNDKAKLINTLHTELTQSIIRGESPLRMINLFTKKFNVSSKNASRLVMTESAFFSSVAKKDCFKFLGVEQYRLIAVLDLKTSQICQDMDNQVFKMSEYEIGITAPPFHPWCRTTTCPHFDDSPLDKRTRIAYDANNKEMHVPANMNYKEWKEKFIKGVNNE